MMKKIELFSFSPTGGTRKVGETFAGALAEEVVYIDLMDRDVQQLEAAGEIIVVAVPVFGGRIPNLAAEKLKTLKGDGKRAVTLAVYGVRAYEDALVEVNDILTAGGFKVIASAACIAQHSMLASVGAGRPDEQDVSAIKAFAQQVAEKLVAGDAEAVDVPGNRPYKEDMKVAQTPITGEGCIGCGVCVEVCPKAALSIVDGKAETEKELCMLCMACVPACPADARSLAPAHQAGIQERLGSFAEVYRENEFFL